MITDPRKGDNPMRLSLVMVVSAVIDFILGIALVLVPDAVGALFGVMAMERLTEQLFGAQLIGIAILNFFARNVQERETRQAIVLANVVANTISFIVALTLTLQSLFNAMGWVMVAIPLVFALGFGYFLLMRPQVA